MMGHSVDEMDWSQDISQICMGGRCITDWDEAVPAVYYEAYGASTSTSCDSGDTHMGEWKTYKKTCGSGCSSQCTTGEHLEWWPNNTQESEWMGCTTGPGANPGSGCFPAVCWSNIYSRCRDDTP